MNARAGLGFSAAVLVGLLGAPGAQAAPSDARPHELIYSAQTVSTNGNKVVIPTSVLNFVLGNQGAANTDTVTIFAPPGATFAGTGGVPGFFECTPAVTGGNSNDNFVTANVSGANISSTGNTWNVALPCRGGDHVQFDNAGNVGLTLSNVAQLAVPGNRVTIYAQYTDGAIFSDSAPFPLVTLIAGNTVAFDAHATTPPLGIDVSGINGSVPGTQFSNGAGGVNPTGFLGTFTLSEVQQISAVTGGPLAAPLVLNGGSVTINGNFLSISQAYLVLNGNKASCAGPAPAGAPTGAVTNNNQISFTIGAAAGNINVPAAFPSSNSWAACIVSGVTAGGAPVQIPVTNTTITAQVNVTNVPNTFTLSADNQPFGSINVNGAVAFFQNVFGQANGYPTFFRVANPSANPAPVFVVMARDGIAQQFTGQLTAVPANNAMFFSADTVAGAVGTTLVAGSQHATVRLLSSTANVLFSAVSQNATTLDISALP